MAAQHLTDHLALHGFTPEQVRRWWLHQANINMNQLIAKRLLGSLHGAFLKVCKWVSLKQSINKENKR